MRVRRNDGVPGYTYEMVDSGERYYVVVGGMPGAMAAVLKTEYAPVREEEPPVERMRVWRRGVARETFEVVDEADRHYIGVTVGGSPERDGVVILPKSVYEPVEGGETVPDYYTYRAPNQRAH